MEGSVGKPMTQEQFDQAKTFMPNTEEVVKTGDVLVIHAQDGELAVAAKECDETIAFFNAFDSYWVAKKSGVTQGVSLDALWFQVEEAWRAMPMHVVRMLPSFRALGVKPT